MKLVKKPMTFEEYVRKYPDYETRLVSFSDAEVKDFNTKFKKSNGKDVPNKYALLNKRKWVHIKDRYYQVPRPISYTWFKGLSNLGKVGVCGGAAVVLAAAIVLPITLSNSKMSAKDFESAIDYIADYTNNKKFKAEGTSAAPDFSTGEITTSDITLEVEDGNIKMKSETASNEADYMYLKYKDNCVYQGEKNSETGQVYWQRGRISEGTDLDIALLPFNELSKNFSKFKKIGDNTYSIKDYNYTATMYGIEAEITTSFDFSFNKNKTIKSAKGSYSTDMGFGENSNEKVEISLDVTFSDVKSHKISDMPELKIDYCNHDALNFDGTTNTYKPSLPDGWVFTNGVREIFMISVGEGFTKANLKLNYVDSLDDSEYKEATFPSETDIYIRKQGGETSIEFTLKEDGKEIEFYIEPSTTVVITIKMNKNYDYMYPTVIVSSSLNENEESVTVSEIGECDNVTEGIGQAGSACDFGANGECVSGDSSNDEIVDEFVALNDENECTPYFLDNVEEANQ